MEPMIPFFLISRRRYPCILSSARPLSLFDLLTWSRLRIGENEWASAVTATGKVLIGAPATESAGMGTRPATPLPSSSETAQVEAPLGLEPGATTIWDEQVDPQSGRTYYINKSTAQTQWERPAEMDAPRTAAVSQPLSSIFTL